MPHLCYPIHRPCSANKLRREALRRTCDRGGAKRCTAAWPFTVQWLPITHSTAETSALLIDTPAGCILHTADWKVDHTPVVGKAFDDESGDPRLALHRCHCL